MLRKQQFCGCSMHVLEGLRLVQAGLVVVPKEGLATGLVGQESDLDNCFDIVTTEVCSARVTSLLLLLLLLVTTDDQDTMTWCQQITNTNWLKVLRCVEILLGFWRSWKFWEAVFR